VGNLWWSGISIERLRGRDVVTIRTLITDDHKVVRQGLRGFLELDPGLEVVGEASNGEEAGELARELKPDVVLMDLLMPVMDGIVATGEIRRELPEVEVVALTSVLEDASVMGAIQAGAIGYLLKTTVTTIHKEGAPWIGSSNWWRFLSPTWTGRRPSTPRRPASTRTTITGSATRSASSS
jgi:CheY-like chemotaxis protein